MERTILLFGGESDERLVSFASAQAMAEVLKDPKLWFWSEKGEIFALEKDELLGHKDPFNQAFKPKNPPIFASIKEALNSSLAKDHVFVLGLHGGTGENGYCQILLEEAHKAFTGSDASASKVAFDKVLTKTALCNEPIKLAPDMVIKANDHSGLEAKLEQFFATHQEFILKPICGGSSLGCIFVKGASDIKTAIQELKASGRDYLAEKLINGREITVGVIDHFGLKALPATEILIDRGAQFDYQGKYLGVGTKEITPADLSPELLKEAQRISLLAHKALGLFGYSRTDLILSTDGFYYLETNTLPGLTKSSLVPQQLACAKISMKDFLAEQVRLAKARLGS
jgi:D-alanine-D-alanine ligase